MTIEASQDRYETLFRLAQEHQLPISQAYGHYIAYFPEHDRYIEADKRIAVSDVGYKDRPEDYKVHLNPEDESLFKVFVGAAALCRRSPSLQSALYQMKVWMGGAEPEYEDLPRLVLYPQNGSEENAATIVNNILPWLGKTEVSGSGRVPRFNASIVEGLCYVAQGSGHDKWHNPAYRTQFEAPLNHALLTMPTGELRNLIDEIKQKL